MKPLNHVDLICPICHSRFSVLMKIASKRRCCSRECQVKFKTLALGTGSARTIHRQKKRLGLTKERVSYSLNENFFDEWSHNLAWILGLIWTDGHLNRNIVSICSTDLEMLKTVQDIIQGSRDPRPRKSKLAWDILINSKKVADFLRSFGLTENKTFTATYPNIPEEYHGSFLRGLIDGDGSVCLRKTNSKTPRLIVELTGASELYKGVQSLLVFNNIHSSLYWEGEKKWRLIIYRVADLIKLYPLMYPQNCACLQRKKAVYDSWINVYYPLSQTYNNPKNNPNCIYCNGATIKAGTRNRKQRLLCKSCKRKFSYVK